MEKWFVFGFGCLLTACGVTALARLYIAYFKTNSGDKPLRISVINLATPWLTLIAIGSIVAVFPLLAEILKENRHAEIIISAHKHAYKTSEKDLDSKESRPAKEKKTEAPQNGVNVVNCSK